MKKIIAVFGLVLALTACADEQAPPPMPVAHELPPKILMNVKRINLADRSVRQPANSPYIDNRFSPTISDAIKQWSGDRLQAVGQSGQAIVIIKEATLTSQQLAVSDSLDMWFTRQQGLRYTGHAEVSLEATAEPGFAIADAAATRSVTLPEHPSLMERQDAYYSLLNGLMKDLGQNLESSIAAHMGNFIAAPPVYGTTSVPVAYSNVAAAPVVTAPVVVQSPALEMPTSYEATTISGMPETMPAPATTVVTPTNSYWQAPNAPAATVATPAAPIWQASNAPAAPPQQLLAPAQPTPSVGIPSAPVTIPLSGSSAYYSGTATY